MDSVQQNILREELAFLVANCECDCLVTFMFSKRVFTDEDMDKVRKEKIPRRQNETFFTILKRRGPKAYPVFLHALEESGQEHIAARLKEKEKKLTTPKNVRITQMYDVPRRRAASLPFLSQEDSVKARMTVVEERVENVHDRVALLEEEREVNSLKEELQEARRVVQENQRKLATAQRNNQRKGKEISDLRKELEKAKLRIQGLERQIKEKEKEVELLRREVQSQREVINETTTTLAQQQKKMTRQENQIAEIQKKNDELERRTLPEEYIPIMMELLGKYKNTSPRKTQTVKGQADAPHPLPNPRKKNDNSALSDFKSQRDNRNKGKKGN